jgi:hypothetical protein
MSLRQRICRACFLAPRRPERQGVVPRDSRVKLLDGFAAPISNRPHVAHRMVMGNFTPPQPFSSCRGLAPRDDQLLANRARALRLGRIVTATAAPERSGIRHQFRSGEVDLPLAVAVRWEDAVRQLYVACRPGGTPRTVVLLPRPHAAPCRRAPLVGPKRPRADEALGRHSTRFRVLAGNALPYPDRGLGRSAGPPLVADLGTGSRGGRQ